MPSRQSSQRHTSSPNASEPRLLVESSESVRRSRLTIAAGLLPPIAMAAAVSGVASCVDSVLALPLALLVPPAAGDALPEPEPEPGTPLAAAAASILRANSCSISVRGRDEEGNKAIALSGVSTVLAEYQVLCLSLSYTTPIDPGR